MSHLSLLAYILQFCSVPEWMIVVVVMMLTVIALSLVKSAETLAPLTPYLMIVSI